MNIKNKVIVNLWLEDGCKQSEDEVSISWHPINFSIFSKLFQDMVYEGVDEWLSIHNLRTERRYELIMEHIIEDATTEHFQVIHKEIDSHSEIRP